MSAFSCSVHPEVPYSPRKLVLFGTLSVYCNILSVQIIKENRFSTVAKLTMSTLIKHAATCN
jgi:hypothetical protein